MTANYVVTAVDDTGSKKITAAQLRKFLDDIGPLEPNIARAREAFAANATEKGGLGLDDAYVGPVMTIGQFFEILMLALLPANPGVANIVWRMAVCGCGFGFFQAPNMKALMSSAPTGRSGGASGIVATARLTGQTSGAALAALCFGLVGRDGATLALALGSAFAIVGSVMSFLRLIATSAPKA